MQVNCGIAYINKSVLAHFLPLGQLRGLARSCDQGSSNLSSFCTRASPPLVDVSMIRFPVSLGVAGLDTMVDMMNGAINEGRK